MSRGRFVALAAALLAVLFAIGPAFAEDNAAKPLKSSTGAVLRSIVVPGWGQYYNEHRLKAGVFFVGEGLFIWGISRNHDLMMGAKTSTDPFFHDYEQFYRNSRNKLIWWLAGTVLLSMGDAYVDAHLLGLDISPDLGPTANPDAAGVRVSYRF
ncbi:hypothetical protein HZB60_06650 [candidate division KSB1 bacterium]|nr:hypothetical protein [candidate division KSB1 bacterium]